MIVFYVILMTILGTIQGLPLAIPSFGGLLLFLLGKLLLAFALNALLISFMLLTRNLPITIIACFLFGMGGTAMLLFTLCFVQRFGSYSRLDVPVLL